VRQFEDVASPGNVKNEMTGNYTSFEWGVFHTSGTPCWDFTLKNNNRGSRKNAVKDSKGVSGIAMNEVLQALKASGVFWAILEQVGGVDVHYSGQDQSNLQEFIQKAEEKGFAIAVMEICEKAHLPHHRRRKYIGLVNIGLAMQVPGLAIGLHERMREWAALAESFNDVDLPEEYRLVPRDFILQHDHTLVCAAREDADATAAKKATMESDPIQRRLDTVKKKRPAEPPRGKKQGGDTKRAKTIGGRPVRCAVNASDAFDAPTDPSGHGIASDSDDADADASTTHRAMMLPGWMGVHDTAHRRAFGDYIMSHENLLRLEYLHNGFFHALEPRFQECVLFWDRKDPLRDLGVEETDCDDLQFFDPSVLIHVNIIDLRDAIVCI